MQKVKVTSIDDYIAKQPAASQAVLSRIRSIIRRAVPEAVETISYAIPAYKLHGKVVIYFAGWKQHYSLYPANERLVQAFQEELEGYKRSKGTIRFPMSEPIPVKLIEGIVKFRADEVAGEVAGKTAEAARKRAAVGSRK